MFCRAHKPTKNFLYTKSEITKTKLDSRFFPEPFLTLHLVCGRMKRHRSGKIIQKRNRLNFIYCPSGYSHQVCIFIVFAFVSSVFSVCSFEQWFTVKCSSAFVCLFLSLCVSVSVVNYVLFHYRCGSQFIHPGRIQWIHVVRMQFGMCFFCFALCIFVRVQFHFIPTDSSLSILFSSFNSSFILSPLFKCMILSRSFVS